MRQVLRDLRVALFYYFLVDFPSREIGKIKRGFRSLRRAASLRGWIAPGNSSPGPRLLGASQIGALTTVSHPTHRAQWPSGVDHLMQRIECIRQTTHLIDETTRDGLLP